MAQVGGVGALDGRDATSRRIAPVLARWRRELGWTQLELAERAGISRGYLSRLERGVPERPGLDVLSSVCAALGRTWAELFAEAGLALPGDVTLDQVAAGIADPELLLYLRRLPELDARDRGLLRALLRALFERAPDQRPSAANDARQLGLPAFGGAARRNGLHNGNDAH
jgi:XRE family transcriptional regulator of biofilm formation